MTEMFNIAVFRDGKNISDVGGEVDEWLDWSLEFISSYNADRIEVRFYTV